MTFKLGKDNYNNFVKLDVTFIPKVVKYNNVKIIVKTSVGNFEYMITGTGTEKETDIPPGTGTSTTTGSKIPAATTLTSEFYNNQDLDGNGKIYGYDFKITDDNSKPSKKPIILCIVEKSPYWTNPTTEITWSAFVASLPIPPDTGGDGGDTGVDTGGYYTHDMFETMYDHTSTGLLTKDGYKFLRSPYTSTFKDGDGTEFYQNRVGYRYIFDPNDPIITNQSLKSQTTNTKFREMIYFTPQPEQIFKFFIPPGIIDITYLVTFTCTGNINGVSSTNGKILSIMRYQKPPNKINYRYYEKDMPYINSLTEAQYLNIYPSPKKLSELKNDCIFSYARTAVTVSPILDNNASVDGGGWMYVITQEIDSSVLKSHIYLIVDTKKYLDWYNNVDWNKWAIDNQDPIQTQSKCYPVNITGVPLIGPTANNAMFYTPDIKGKAPHTVQFHDLSSGGEAPDYIGGVTSWKWDFGDGSTSTEQNPIHVYTKTGTYDVILEVAGTGKSVSPIIIKENYIKVM